MLGCQAPAVAAAALLQHSALKATRGALWLPQQQRLRAAVVMLLLPAAAVGLLVCYCTSAAARRTGPGSSHGLLLLHSLLLCCCWMLILVLMRNPGGVDGADYLLSWRHDDSANQHLTNAQHHQH
jgi:hypothetical protein